MRTNFFDSKCQQCKNKGFDAAIGTICNLTGEKKSLTDTCDNFEAVPSPITQKDYRKLPTPMPNRKVSVGIRFANYLIDTLVRVILGVIIGVIFGITGHTDISRLESNLIMLVLAFVYYLLFESLMGQTIGKLITQTIVVTEEGERPDFSEILGRSLSRFIPFDALSFFGETASGWHDSVSGTKVIFKSEYKKEKVNPELLDSDLT